MTTEIRNVPAPAPSGTNQGSAADCHGNRLWVMICKLCTGIEGIFVKKAKPGDIPVVHDNVTLSADGAKVWQQVADPASPVGKPVQHRRRPIAE
jgi:hypothetical protein